MLIEPSGNIKLVSSGDQIHAESEFRCWGLSAPQSSVEPAVLNDACFKIAESCKARCIVGYFTLDFVTFIHPTTASTLHLLISLCLWCVIILCSFDNGKFVLQLLDSMSVLIMTVCPTMASLCQV